MQKQVNFFLVDKTMIFEFSYKNVKISVITGDITRLEVDAIVNPANTMLIMGGGVAGAIKRVGGREIEDEAIKSAPVPVGKAIATHAGKLKAKYVIHAPTMEKPAMQITADNVKLAMDGALNCAEQLGVKSVAFPGMGTGVGGLKPEEATRVMVTEVKRHLRKGMSLERIVFVGFNEDLTEAFERAIHEVLAR